jgi:hypothetical protein
MTDITFEEYLLKTYDINQIEEKEDKQRVLRNNTFRVSSKRFKEFFLPTFLLRRKTLEEYIKGIEISTKERNYLDFYERLNEAVTDKKTLLKYLDSHAYAGLKDKYNEVLYWKKEFNLSSITLNELQSLTKDSIELEVKESIILSDLIIRYLKEYYQNLLNDSINNKQLITTIKDDIKKFDMTIKYDKRLINCKIITI